MLTIGLPSTGGMTQIDLKGIEGQTMEQKWKNGVYTQLGIAVAGFPNLFFCYGPQAPTAFATGPSHAEHQGSFIVNTLKYMREHDYKTVDATHEAEKAYKEELEEIAYKGLFSQADSWLVDMLKLHRTFGSFFADIRLRS